MLYFSRISRSRAHWTRAAGTEVLIASMRTKAANVVGAVGGTELVTALLLVKDAVVAVQAPAKLPTECATVEVILAESNALIANSIEQVIVQKP
jgi:hypothetical protein